MAASRSGSSEIDGWLRDLGSDDRVLAEAAKEALADAGPVVVPRLIELIDADEDRLRTRAISLLSLLGHSRCTAPLASLFHDPSPAIRSRAAGALSRLPSASSVAALSKLLQREPVESVRRVAARALVRLMRAGRDEALDQLLDLLSDPAELASVRLTALDAIPWIAQVEKTDAVAVRAILDRLANGPEPRVAKKARRLIASPPRVRLEPETVERLLDDLASPRLAAWRRAVTILGAAGGASVEPVVAAMRARSGDGEYARRCGLLLRGLSPRQLARLAPHLDERGDPTTLATLVDVAAEAGSQPLLARLARLVDRLAEAGESEGPGPLHAVRCNAHLALARAGSRLAAADLRRLLDDARYPVEPELAEAAAAIGTRAELPSLFRAYLRSRGVARLSIRDAVETLVRRERVRRTDRWIARLEPRERRAAREILGSPRAPRRRETLRGSRVDRPPGSLLT